MQYKVLILYENYSPLRLLVLIITAGNQLFMLW